MRASARILGVVLLLLLLAASLIWYAAIKEDHRGKLVVSFLDVGAGDAVFVQAPSGRQVLIDGGPDDSVLLQLGKVMPFYDRSIDIIIASAPDAGKVGGLASVLSRYGVSAVARSAAHSGAPQVQAFDGAITSSESRGTRLLIAQRGQVIDLGGGAYIETLFPDRDASGFSAGDGCLILRLVFGKTSFLFSCGSPSIENYLATLDGTKLKSDVLLAASDDTELFTGFVSPQYVVAPQACGSAATSSAFSKLGIQTLDTCQGEITFVSDGQTVARN
jgi:competence protein ComEC